MIKDAASPVEIMRRPNLNKFAEEDEFIEGFNKLVDKVFVQWLTFEDEVDDALFREDDVFVLIRSLNAFPTHLSVHSTLAHLSPEKVLIEIHELNNSVEIQREITYVNRETDKNNFNNSS